MSKRETEVSVILPTYNEAGHINALIKGVINTLRDAKYAHEIIIVDDNSPDGTAQKVEEAYAGEKNITLIIRKERGLATAIMRGLREATGTYIVLMDTDFNHNPLDIKRLIAYAATYPIVVGSRFVRGGGMKGARLRWLGSYGFNLFVRMMLGLKTKENQSGFLVIQKRIFTAINPEQVFYGYGDYSIRLFYEAKKKGYAIKEVPVVYQKRMSGESKTNFLRELIRYTISVLRLRFVKQKKEGLDSPPCR